jgi:hypothetical protein
MSIPSTLPTRACQSPFPLTSRSPLTSASSPRKRPDTGYNRAE